MPDPGSLLIWCLALCAAGAAAVWTVRHRLVLIGFVAAQCLAALAAAAAVLAGGSSTELALWPLSSLGSLVLVLDPLAALFLAVTALVFLIGVVFAAGASRRQPRSASFAAGYQLLFGAIVLLLAAGDVLSFMIGWELMSLLIFGLVTLDGAQSAGRADTSCSR